MIFQQKIYMILLEIVMNGQWRPILRAIELFVVATAATMALSIQLLAAAAAATVRTSPAAAAILSALHFTSKTRFLMYARRSVC